MKTSNSLPLQKQPPEVLYKKGVLRNFVKKIKKKTWHNIFPVDFAKFLRAPFLQNASGLLLLPLEYIKSKGFLDVSTG